MMSQKELKSLNEIVTRWSISDTHCMVEYLGIVFTWKRDKKEHYGFGETPIMVYDSISYFVNNKPVTYWNIIPTKIEIIS